MELAGRVFDVITDIENIRHDSVRNSMPKFDTDQSKYWRRVLRMAALCHDIGHLPFSHAAEKELLPEKVSHEDITVELINSPEMKKIWESMTPPLTPLHISKLAVGKKHLPKEKFSIWESILSEIITGDAFGVDRMDYLLRDALHTGVSYGLFDHLRLIDTLRILPKTEGPEGGEEPTLGTEAGGLKAAEGLIIARYFMFSQVYCHPVRMAYNSHLKDFMVTHYGKNSYPENVQSHLAQNDNGILSKISVAAEDKKHSGHDPARRILERDHFRRVYESNPDDQEINPAPEAVRNMCEKLQGKFGRNNLFYDEINGKPGGQSFPVLIVGDRIQDSTRMSEILEKDPLRRKEYVFCDSKIKNDVSKFIDNNRADLLQIAGEAR